MKRCFHFPTWEEQKDVMISLDENYIIAPQISEEGFFDGNNSKKYVSLIPSDPNLAKICAVTLTMMYGDYVVINYDDLIYQQVKEWEKIIACRLNILREYSKFLRKEENKWEEVKAVLGI